MKHRILCVAAAALALLSLCPLVEAQTAGTVTLTPSVTSCLDKCTPTLTWSTSPAATSCSAPWTTKTTASGSQAVAEITKTSKFDLTCTWPGTIQQITVTYELPTQNTDNSPLLDLTGVRVYFGTSAASLTRVTALAPPPATSITFSPPSAGAWVMAARAVNSKGAESDNSNLISATSTSTSPAASASATVTVDTKPKPPTNAVATVAIAGLTIPLDSKDGFLRTPVFTITASGPGTLVGFAKVGTPCTENAFVYKAQIWCKLLEKHPSTRKPNIAWIGDPRSIDTVAAPGA